AAGTIAINAGWVASTCHSSQTIAAPCDWGEWTITSARRLGELICRCITCTARILYRTPPVRVDPVEHIVSKCLHVNLVAPASPVVSARAGPGRGECDDLGRRTASPDGKRPTAVQRAPDRSLGPSAVAAHRRRSECGLAAPSRDRFADHDPAAALSLRPRPDRAGQR